MCSSLLINATENEVLREPFLFLLKPCNFLCLRTELELIASNSLELSERSSITSMIIFLFFTSDTLQIVLKILIIENFDTEMSPKYADSKN